MSLSMTLRAAAFSAGLVITTAGAALAAPITPTPMLVPLPGATFGGSGIPNDAVAVATIVHEGNTITLGLTAHQRFENDPLLNDGAGTFTARSGANFGDPTFMTMPSASLGATWNFAFHVDIQGGGTIGQNYDVELLYDLDAGTDTDETDLGVIDLGIFAGATLLEGSENLNFGFLTTGIGGFVTPPMATFDPFANGEYSFSLRLLDSQSALLGEAAINVNVVPEPGTLAILGIGLAGLGAFGRRRG